LFLRGINPLHFFRRRSTPRVGKLNLTIRIFGFGLLVTAAKNQPNKQGGNEKKQFYA